MQEIIAALGGLDRLLPTEEQGWVQSVNLHELVGNYLKKRFSMVL